MYDGHGARKFFCCTVGSGRSAEIGCKFRRHSGCRLAADHQAFKHILALICVTV
jgi:hypothetical protein